MGENMDGNIQENVQVKLEIDDLVLSEDINQNQRGFNDSGFFETEEKSNLKRKSIESSLPTINQNQEFLESGSVLNPQIQSKIDKTKFLCDYWPEQPKH